MIIENKKEKWFIPTMLVLALVTAVYFLLLFPEHVSLIVGTFLKKYFIFISALVIAILVVHFLIRLYSKSVKEVLVVETRQKFDQVKRIDQIIWRNRYVLNAKKVQLLFEQSAANIEKWEKEKLSFAQKNIFTKPNEITVSYDIISQRIETSLSNASIGGVRPPTYVVNDID